MKNYKFIFLIIFICSISCSTGRHANQNAENDLLNCNIEPKVITIQKVSKEPNYLLTGKYHHFFLCDSSMRKINTRIDSVIDKKIDDFLQEVSDAYKQEELRDYYVDFQSSLKITSQIKFMTDDLLSLEVKFEIDQPLGTYFPSTDYEFLNSDFHSGREITLDDFFRENLAYEDLLINSIRDKHSENINISNSEIGFMLTPNDLVLVGKDYEMSKLSFKNYYFKWKELSDFLDEKYLRIFCNEKE